MLEIKPAKWDDPSYGTVTLDLRGRSYEAPFNKNTSIEHWDTAGMELPLKYVKAVDHASNKINLNESSDTQQGPKDV